MSKKPVFKEPTAICIGSLKGGGGKSNIASNLSVAFQNRGLSVLLIDSDRILATNESWSNDREKYIEANPDSGVKLIPTIKKNGKIKGTIEESLTHYDVVIIDTGGQDSQELRGAAGIAQIVLTPIEPTQEALDGVAPFLEIVDTMRDFNEDLKVAGVVSRIAPNAAKRRIEEARAYLDDFSDQMTTFEGVITQRMAYPDAKENGLSVFEGKDETAQKEVDALADSLVRLAELKVEQ